MSRKTGLTLIETLLAMVILGIGLSILVSSAGRALSVAKRARHFATARHLFDIVELENPIPDVEEAAETTESGGFDAPNDAYTWTRTVEPSFDFEGEETGYFTLRTRVMWSDRGQQSYEEMVTGVFAAADEKGARPDAEALDAETEAAGAAPGGARGALPGGRGAPGAAGGPRGMGTRGAEGTGMGRGAGRAGAGRAFTAGGGQGGGRGGSRGGASGGGGGGAPGGGGGGGGGPPPPPGFR
jgi:prepilin-type N-terminal cleavage/methylation domain-containing protein